MTVKRWRGDAPAVAQVTTVTIAGPEEGDVFTMTINGKSISTTATASSTAATIAAALVVLWTASELFEFQEVTAEASGAVITLTANTPGLPFVVTVTSDADGGANEVQTLTMNNTPTGGTFTLTYTEIDEDDNTTSETTAAIAYNASAATVEAALEAVTLIGAGNVSCSGGAFPGTPIVVTFTGDLAETNVQPLAVNFYSLTGGDAAVSISEVQAGASGTNKRVDFDELTGASGGTWKFSVGGVESEALDYNMTAGDLQTELETFFGIGNVTCAGGPWPSTINATFTGDLAGSEVPEIRAGTISLTGGTVATGTVTETQPGTAGVNELQQMTLPSDVSYSITGGRFRVGFNGVYTSYFQLPYEEASDATTLRDAIAALPGIGAGNIAVDSGRSGESVRLAGGGHYLAVTFQNELASTNMPLLTLAWENMACDGADGNEIEAAAEFETITPGYSGGNEQQTISVTFSATGGYFYLTFGGQTTTALPFGATAAQVKAALEALSTIPVGALVCTGGPIESADIVVEFAAKGMQATDQDPITIDVKGCSVWIQTGVNPVAGVNEVQSIAIPTDTHAGTFTLTFDSQTTASLQYSATAAQVQAALLALSSIGGSNVVCTGGPLPSATIYVEFVRSMKFTDQIAMTAADSLANGTVTITTTTPGVADDSISASDTVASEGPNHWDTAENWAPVGVPQTGDEVFVEDGDVDILHGLAQSAVTLARLSVGSRYTGAVGLPRWNESGYFEYRETALEIGATLLEIGDGDGSGAGRINIDVGSVQTAATIYNTGGSVDPNVSPCKLTGTHASNTLTVYGGEVAVALFADQSSTFATVTQHGGTLIIGEGVTLGDVYSSSSGSLRIDNATISGNLILA